MEKELNIAGVERQAYALNQGFNNIANFLIDGDESVKLDQYPHTIALIERFREIAEQSEEVSGKQGVARESVLDFACVSFLLGLVVASDTADPST